MSPKRKWMTRLVVAVNALIACALLLLTPESPLGRAIHATGIFGDIALSALIFVGAWALVDTVINDLLPARYVLECALRYRHTIYLLISLGCLSMIFVIVKTQGAAETLAYYGLVAMAAFTVAVMDIRDRMKGYPR